MTSTRPSFRTRRGDGVGPASKTRFDCGDAHKTSPRRRKRSKRPRQTKMILTTCAACAAPLAHTAPRCIRCQTRYCNTHPSRRRARVTSARTCAARAATGKPPGAGIPGLAGRARPNGSVASTSGGPRARLKASASSTRRAFHEWWIRKRPRETRGWLISRGAACPPTGPTGTWKATTNKNHDY